VILLSSLASPAVRQEVDKHSSWDLWDTSDLCQKVRDVAAVNPEGARELVDHHFGPRWRRDFLGLPAIAAFLSPVDFFRELLGTARLFHHSFELIGRAGQLTALTEFVRVGGARVAILPGRGGIGKSRLLRALAQAVEEAAPEPAFRFLVEGVPITVESLDELPNRPCLVVVDDAHRCEGIELLLTHAHRRPNLKFLLATRPHGLSRIHSALTRSGFDLRESTDLPSLAPLTFEETLALARAAIGSGQDTTSALIVERLARVTRDCPLATVVGGRLLAENAIPPELLAQDESFRRSVFDRFQDELLGRLGPWFQAEFARRALGALAAINPIPATQSDALLRQIADFLGGDPVELASLIGELERVGLLVRRGGRLRLTPDVLADHILASACLTPQNRPTGFAQRAFDHFRDTCPDLVLRNIAELDWRVRASGSEEPGLIDGMWASLEAAFREGRPAARVRIIDLVTGAAYYQPRRALQLAEVAVRGEAEVNDPYRSSRGEGESESWRDVLRRLPELLLRSAYDPETLPRCLELLWEISLRLRRSGQDPSQATRVILDLAKLEHDKPVWVNEAVARSVRRWFKAATTIPDQRQVIVEIIDVLLSKSGSDSWSEGNRLTIYSFYVSPAKVRGIRRTAVAILGELLGSTDVALQLRVLGSVERALNGPMPSGQPPTPELLAEWEPDQLRILELLSGFLGQPRPPILQLRTIEAVKFQATYGPRPAVRERALTVVRQLEASFEVRLTRVLLTRLARWDQMVDDHEGQGENRDIGAAYAERLQRCHEQVVAEIWERYPDAESASAFLAETMAGLLSVEREVDPRQLLWYMLEARPTEAIRFARLLITTPESPLAQSLPIFLARARRVDPEGTTRLATEMLESPSDRAGSLFRAVLAHHYSWDWPTGLSLNEADIAIVRRLLADPNQAIRVKALQALQHLAVTRASLAIELAMSVDPGDSAQVADELARLTVRSQLGSLTGFTTDDFARMLIRFESVTSLGHWVCELLTSLAGTMPDAVLDCFLRRVATEERLTYRTTFNSLPDRGLSILGNVFAAMNGHDCQTDFARRVRDQAVAAKRFSGASLARLFRAVSGNYGPRGMEVLREWIDSGNSAQVVAAIELLREAGPTFVFEHRHFVEHAMEKGDAQGDDCGDLVYSRLLQLSLYYGQCGLVSEIFQQDLAIRDRATVACEAIQPGTRLYRLYDAIRRHAESNIRQQAERIEEDENF
jgi:hypothetical protein